MTTVPATGVEKRLWTSSAGRAREVDEGMSVPIPWKPVAIVSTLTTALLSLLLLPACCCMRTKSASTAVSPQTVQAQIGLGSIPTPTEAQSKAPTQIAMRNVWFHIDQQGYLDIHELRGELVSKELGAPVNFDNKLTFVLKIDTGTIGMKSASLDILMNRYVFGYPGAPLRDLQVTTSGQQLRLEGIIHKIVDLPFVMHADVSASNGKIRIHPTKIDLCGVNGLGLLKAIGQSLEKMLKLPAERGVVAEVNDMLLDPVKILPPPTVEMKLVAVRVEGDELIQIVDAGRGLSPLRPPREVPNYLYLRGGTLRLGKLLMVDADLETVDADPSDPFDFFIDRYNDQLVAGFSRNTVDYGLIATMRDFSDLGAPPRPGESVPPDQP